MKHEFDNYIKNYHQDLDKSLSISGETSDFFAYYKAKKLFAWLPQYNASSCTILDFGCGDGTMAHYVAQLFSDALVSGIDPSEKSIVQARKQYQDIPFHVSHQESFDSLGTFDLIYAANVFHHIPRKDHKKTLKTLLQQLKLGGHFVLFEHNPYNPLTRYTFNHCPIDRNATMLTHRYAKQLCASHGKTHTKFYFFFPAFLKWLRRFEPYLIHVPIGAQHATIVQKI